MTDHAQTMLADRLEWLCCAETEKQFFDCITDNIDTIVATLRAPAPVAVRDALDCLRSIAEAIDCEPRADDDADWRSRFLETKRAAQCALAAIPHEQEAKPVGWFNPWNDYQGYQQVAKEFEGSEGTIPLYAAPPSAAAESCPTCGRVDNINCSDSFHVTVRAAAAPRETREAFDKIISSLHEYQRGYCAGISDQIETQEYERKISEQERRAAAEPGEMREALEKMVAEFSDYHYDQCPADMRSGPCECYAGIIISRARAALALASANEGSPK